MTLSIVMVTRNSAEVVEGALKSISGLWDELLVGDGGSTDGTVEMVKKYGGVIIRQIRPILLPQSGIHDAVIPIRIGNSIGTIRPMKRKNLGERKQELVERAKGEWILVLDADERVSPKLAQEIRRIIKGSSTALGTAVAAYRIPYQNYVFGRPVYYGGERYAKMRLFRKGFARISPEALHEEVIVPTSLKLRGVNRLGSLKGKIHHYSYRTPWQLFTKFRGYAWTAAGEKKWQGETLTVKKLFLYAPHMFWARFVKEKGYRDGWRGLVLAFAFGYMEGLTYWFLLFRALTIF